MSQLKLETYSKYSKELNPDTTIQIGNARYALDFEIFKEKCKYDEDLLLDVNGEPTYFGKFYCNEQGQAILTELKVNQSSYNWKATRMTRLDWEIEDFSDGLIDYKNVGTSTFVPSYFSLDFMIKS